MFDGPARIFLRVSAEAGLRTAKRLLYFDIGRFGKLEDEIGTQSPVGTRDDECAFHVVQCSIRQS